MTLLKIAQVGHPVLRQVARDLSLVELASEKWQTFIADLIETMRDANGAGLAANQVYTPVRICALEVKANNPRYPYKPEIPLTVLVNPRVTPLSEATFENYEGCLSVPDMRGVVDRFAEVSVEYLTPEGEAKTITAKGITAGTYQHEIDHLDGKLFLDRVTDPTTLSTWKNFDAHHKEGFVKRAEEVVAKWGG